MITTRCLGSAAGCGATLAIEFLHEGIEPRHFRLGGCGFFRHGGNWHVLNLEFRALGFEWRCNLHFGRAVHNRKGGCGDGGLHKDFFVLLEEFELFGFQGRGRDRFRVFCGRQKA